MDTLTLSRHGESLACVADIVNGDPERDGGLSSLGRRQAAELGSELREQRIDLCVTSEFPRTHETASIALEGRETSSMIDARLNDIRYGDFEGLPRAAYHEWAVSNGVATPLPGGGESRGDVARRLCDALDDLLSRDLETVLVVTHELLIHDVIAGTQCLPPPELRVKVEYASPHRFTGEDIYRSTEFLRQWLESYA